MLVVSHLTEDYADLPLLTFEMYPQLLRIHLAFDTLATVNLKNISEEGFSCLSCLKEQYLVIMHFYMY